MTLSLLQLFEAIETTWPAAEKTKVDPWVLRRGAGGGKRVSSATASRPVDTAEIMAAEAAMARWDQEPLFALRPQDSALDQQLDLMGYAIVDPTNVYSVCIERLTDVPMPPVTTFCVWEPLAIMTEIWASGGIGPDRLAVMARAEVKTGILARWNEKPAGVAFAALHAGICMVHAVEILPTQRRQGVAGWIMRAAAFWAQAQGASHVSVLCRQSNGAANRLYSALGFVRAGHYHYRQRPTEGGSGHD